jgi:hypothetical protein
MENLATGERIDVSRSKADAFWAGAVIETLRRTGVRVEELLEITHLALVPYRLPDTGEILPLLQIVPSKNNEERLLLVTPELAHVLARVRQRAHDGQPTVPLVRRYDPHERVTSPSLPYLFQRIYAAQRRVISPAYLGQMITATIARTGITGADREPVHVTPPRFPQGLRHRGRQRRSACPHRREDPRTRVADHCKDPATGRRLGAKCPKLRRPGGAWNSNHGTWSYQVELPTPPGQNRRQLRHHGFASRDDAADERDLARDLLDLAGGDEALAYQIADMLLEARRADGPLPDRDTVARRIRAGVPASVTTTTAEYLTTWLQQRRGLAEKTVRSYSDHVRLYLIPHLGKVPLQALDSSHIETMFTELETRNNEIRAARDSTDPDVRKTVKGVRPLSAASLQRLRATLRKALNDAIYRYKLRQDNRPPGSSCPRVRPRNRGCGPGKRSPGGRSPASAPARSWCGRPPWWERSSTTPKPTTSPCTRCTCSSCTGGCAAARRAGYVMRTSRSAAPTPTSLPTPVRITIPATSAGT